MLSLYCGYQIKAQVLEDELPEFEVDQDVSDELMDLCSKCLMRDVAQRPTAKMVVKELEKIRAACR